jgi:hypothetical protein
VTSRLWRLLALLIYTALLVGCGSAPAPTPLPALRLLADPAPILAALPPALDSGAVVAPAPPADPTVLAAWGQPAARWRDLARRAAQLDGLDPTGIEAELTTLDAALQDGLALAAHARAQGRAVADDAVTAELAWRLIARAHPLRADAARAEAEVAAWVGAWRGIDSPAAVLAGRLLGAAVAQAISATLPPAA